MPCRGWVTGAASLRACSSSAAGEHGVAAGDQLLQAGLHVVGTPIGNLQDLSPRALHVLRSVERILCEDTRHTAHLCSYFDVHTPLESLHEHNELAKCAKVVRELTLGTSLALVSDAGLPAVSDPGGRLIAAAVEAGVPIIPVPGPSALLTAAVASGFDTSRMMFIGFLPAKQQARRKELEQMQGLSATVVAFVSPHALRAALRDMCDVLGGDRRVVLGREMTKLHEQFLRGTLQELEQLHDPDRGGRAPRGEYTVVLAPPEGGRANDQGPDLTDDDVRSALAVAIGAGHSRSSAAAFVAQTLCVSKKRAYRLSLEAGKPAQGEQGEQD